MLVLSGLFVWQEGDRDNRTVWYINSLASSPEVEVGEAVEIDPPYRHKNLFFHYGVVLEEIPFKPLGRAAHLKVGFKSRTYAELWAKEHIQEVHYVPVVSFPVSTPGGVA